MITRLAWVTARDARGLDEDEPLVLGALQAAGVLVEVVDWDDPGVDWAEFDRVVLGSPWDYAPRLIEFLSWLDHVNAVTHLVNSLDTVRWNINKQYLSELAAAGVPIIPTDFVGPHASPTFPSGEFVVKPAVGAGSKDAASYGPDQHDLALAHVARLHAAGQVVLVQPYLRSVAAEGEWALLYFQGQFSHAAGKRVALPRAGAVKELFAKETVTEHLASAEQVQVAQAALDVVTARLGTPTYARIDLVRDDAGRFCVLELELIEPSKFLPHAAGSAQRLAAALVR